MVDAWLAAEGDDHEAGMERFAAAMFVRSDSEGSLIGEGQSQRPVLKPAVPEGLLHDVEVRGEGWGSLKGEGQSQRPAVQKSQMPASEELHGVEVRGRIRGMGCPGYGASSLPSFLALDLR